MGYASKNKIILELNEKDIDGWYLLLEVTYYNNTEILKLLIEYANKNKIILELNGKNYKGYYPILNAIYKSNTEMV